MLLAFALKFLSVQQQSFSIRLQWWGIEKSIEGRAENGKAQ